MRTETLKVPGATLYYEIRGSGPRAVDDPRRSDGRRLVYPPSIVIRRSLRCTGRQSRSDLKPPGLGRTHYGDRGTQNRSGRVLR
jgi:hypothetical protein